MHKFLNRLLTWALVIFGIALLLLVISGIWNAPDSDAHAPPLENVTYLPVIAYARPPEISNAGFESVASTNDALWYNYPSTTPILGTVNEIASPTPWLAWFSRGAPCCPTLFVTGQPETHYTSFSTRIRSGSQAYQLFTFYRCHDMGILQQVKVTPGDFYQFCYHAHSWYTNCSTKPNWSRLDDDCMTFWSVRLTFAAGIDPTGNVDPLGDRIQWGDSAEKYNQYDEAICSPIVQAESDTLTVLTRSITSHPLKHNDTYLDDAVLCAGACEGQR